MPLGASRLSFLAKTAEEAGVADARAYQAVLDDGGEFSFSSSVKHVGTHSAQLGQNDDGTITIYPSDSGFDFDTSNSWTFEISWRFTSSFGYRTFYILDGPIDVYDSHSGSNAQLNAYYGGNNSFITDATNSNNVNTWYHWCCEFDADTQTFRMYDGSSVRTTKTSSFSFGSNKKWQLYWGGSHYQGSLYFDNCRISNVARYKGSRSVPTSAFTNDENTLALFHFDNNLNDDTLVGVAPDYTVPTAAFTSDSSTELLVHWDGTNGQTSATDSSSNNRTIEFYNTAQLTTSTQQFGTACLETTSNTGSATIPGSSNDNDLSLFTSGQYTAECWVYITAFSGISRTTSGITSPKLFGNHNRSGGPRRWSFGPLENGKLHLSYYDGSSWQYMDTASAVLDTTADLNKWHHVGFYCDGSNVTFFLNGDIVLDSEPVVNGVSPNTSRNFTFIAYDSGAPNLKMDEMRVSKSNRYGF